MKMIQNIGELKTTLKSVQITKNKNNQTNNHLKNRHQKITPLHLAESVSTILGTINFGFKKLCLARKRAASLLGKF